MTFALPRALTIAKDWLDFLTDVAESCCPVGRRVATCDDASITVPHVSECVGSRHARAGTDSVRPG
jgi:hypothetical protein